MKIVPKKSWLVFEDQPIIRKKLNKVILPLNKDQKALIKKMITYIDFSYYNDADVVRETYKLNPGIGIAANQLGFDTAIIYIHFDEFTETKKIEHKYLLANPEIISESYQKIAISNGEGCLSVKKEHKGYVIRKAFIKVKAIDLATEKEVMIDAKGLLSICLQHEIDHLNGKLFYDRIDKNQFLKEQNLEILKIKDN